MLRRNLRLRSEEVREVLAKGRPLRGKGLLSARMLKTSASGLRAAAVVSKSVAKSAVARNRLRRAVYRVLREAPKDPHGMFVFFLRATPTSPMAPKLKDEIEGILNEAQSFRANAKKG